MALRVTCSHGRRRVQGWSARSRRLPTPRAATPSASGRWSRRVSTHPEAVARITVIKVGGSVLTDDAAYRRAATFVAARLTEHPDDRLVVVVSAEHGVTDALLATAREIVDVPDPATLDLLWSTGELRSAALLALHLQALGVRAAALNVHQTGLTEPDVQAGPGRIAVRRLRLAAALARHDVVVTPGFLAR